MSMDRRSFIEVAGAAGALLSAGYPGSAVAKGDRPDSEGWERRPMRWFQLAFTEDDPGRFDPQFWLDYLEEIKADAVCLSAGGGIAFYPTRVPLHGRSKGLGDQDPFGVMVEGCRQRGMNVVARIDPHAMTDTTFAAAPQWVARSIDGKPRRHWTASDLYLTCPYGAYNFEFMPQVIEEIALRYPVDAFFGNRWNTLGLCYCDSCRSMYREATGREIPAVADPSTEEGRTYVRWGQQRMLRLMDEWNTVIARHRPGAFFISGTERRGPVDYDGADLGRRQRVVFCDRQARYAGAPAWDSGRYAKEMRAYMFDKPVGNIISVGVEERYRWKDSVQSEAEIRIWTAGALAHGSRPWITKFNAKPLDRRWMPVVSDIYRWHHRNERYFRNTRSLAEVAIVISARTEGYIGGTAHRRDLEGHRSGIYQALLEARIPFDMLDEAWLDPAHMDRYRVLILPNVATLSDTQCGQLRDFVKRGGSVVATHRTSLFDENGEARADFGLADLFGCHFEGRVDERVQNSYLTLRHPHPALAPLDRIERIIGTVQRVHVRAERDEDVVATLVPSYPDLPMERVFTTATSSNIPMALCRTVGNGRVVYLPMDIDRTFDELVHGDHLSLIRGMVDWATNAPQPMGLSGKGLVDIALWSQERSMTAHLVNLNNAMTMRGGYREAVPLGPLKVTMAIPASRTITSVRLLEADTSASWMIQGDKLIVDVPSVAYHEVVAVDLA